MAKEVFSHNVSHRNIGEIKAKNNAVGTPKRFWDRIADSIENGTKDSSVVNRFADYREIDATPEEKY